MEKNSPKAQAEPTNSPVPASQSAAISVVAQTVKSLEDVRESNRRLAEMILHRDEFEQKLQIVEKFISTYDDSGLTAVISKTNGEEIRFTSSTAIQAFCVQQAKAAREFLAKADEEIKNFKI